MCIAYTRIKVEERINDCCWIKPNMIGGNNAKNKPQKHEIGHSPSGNFFLSFFWVEV
jgi:hypothetical protein